MPQFARFLIAGGLAALVNIASRLLFSLAAPFEWAVVLAYLIGMATAYVLNRMFVFEPTGRAATSEIMWFVLVNLVALALVFGISVGLSRLVFPALGFTWHAETVAHVIGVLAPAVTSYFGHKHFSFRRG